MKPRFLVPSAQLLLSVLITAACGSLFGQNLLIDFNSTTQDGGPHPQTGYQSYDAGHEVIADFVTQSFPAFGTTIDVTPAWPNTTDNRVQQMIDRGAGNDGNWDNGNGDLDLVTDWLGIDTRTGNGGNGNWDGGGAGTPTYMTLTLAGLPAETYGWTSFHHDTENVHSFFQVELSTDGGNTFANLGQDFYMSDSTTGGNPNSDDPGNGFPGPQVGPDATTLISTVNLQVEANGVDEVVLRFAPLSNTAVHRQLWGINGFQLSPLSDADGDGLADTFEQQIIDSDPNDTINTIDDVLPGDDFDNDDSSNEEESDNNTDPTDPDTDADGALDGAEDGGGTWVSATQTGTDPLVPDTDGDGLLDGTENPDLAYDSGNPTTQPGTDPNEEDSDGDGESDGDEVNEDGTDPTDPDDFFEPVERGEGLFVDFNSTTQDGGPHNQEGYQAYDAGHEVAADFVTQSYEAFGATVTVTPGWPNSTDNRVRQMIDRGGGNDGTWDNGNNDIDLVTDWLGADTRTGNGGNGNWDGGAGGTPTYLTLTLGDLPRGNYEWISFHHDTEHVHGFFQIEISNDGGANFENLGQDFYMSDSTTAGNPDSDDPGNGFPGPQVGPDASTLISTVTLNFSATGDDVILRFAALANSAVHRQLVAINGFQLFQTGGAGVRITDFSRAGSGDLTISWESKAGKLYNLRSQTDPSVDLPVDWPIFDGNMDLVATPPENTLSFPLPADAERYFVIEEFNAPPVVVYSDDFESGQGGWTIGGDEGNDPGTNWELGSPANVGPAAANSPANCFGTNLSASYTDDALIWLRSPAIDLTTASGATLSFFQSKDIEINFDSGTVNVLDAADDSFIVEVQADIDGFDLDWKQFTKKLPAEALGKTIKIEFLFSSDNFNTNPQAGWYVDDVQVTVP